MSKIIHQYPRHLNLRHNYLFVRFISFSKKNQKINTSIVKTEMEQAEHIHQPDTKLTNPTVIDSILLLIFCRWIAYSEQIM